MFANWNGCTVSVYEDNGVIVRKISCRSNIKDAVVSGNGHVTVQLENGWTEIYETTGQLIRRITR